MASYSYSNIKIWLLSILVFGVTLLPVSQSRTTISTNIDVKATKTDSNFKVKGANLGGWLVIEGWIKPSLFEGIPNKDFLDGVSLNLKSLTTKKYLCVESGGGSIVVASCTSSATFKLWRINESTFRIKVDSNQFWKLDGTKVVANVNNYNESETFDIIKESNSSSRVRIKALSTGYYLQAKTEDSVTADVSKVNGWGDSDATVFNLTITNTIQGDFQLQNGYGPKASQVMKDHWNNFIVEDDFKFLADNGLNAVRAPVGWWTAYDPNPPFPYVSGSLEVLDNTFKWAEKYGLKVILDLHAAPGSQNGVAHSATRDGNLDWGSDETINQTLEVIEFFTKRYVKSKALYGIELLNEPLAPYITKDTVVKYYKAGYNVVRKYSKTVYVVLSTRLQFTVSDDPPPTELIPLANTMERSVVDVHWYSLYYSEFNNLNAQQNIDYVHVNRTTQINQLVTPNTKPLIYVGEWSADWNVANGTDKQVKEFAAAQLRVYEKATFGWTFWTLKNVQNRWSFKWLIENGFINVKELQASAEAPSPISAIATVTSTQAPAPAPTSSAYHSISVSFILLSTSMLLVSVFNPFD